ncbi:unnamed protein product [Polarella glacialis]|uniref:Uncharacterized protein n=1 Tax=Polarella glacialis TaxID=89957 RepID=A0A813KNY0_POLGL|nr:unnamed protein product [Polarella glacialis]
MGTASCLLGYPAWLPCVLLASAALYLPCCWELVADVSGYFALPFRQALLSRVFFLHVYAAADRICALITVYSSSSCVRTFSLQVQAVKRMAARMYHGNHLLALVCFGIALTCCAGAPSAVWNPLIALSGSYGASSVGKVDLEECCLKEYLELRCLKNLVKKNLSPSACEYL